jgi:succinate dehydrogenase / fumarate reductase iron-sulfur subunit
VQVQYRVKRFNPEAGKKPYWTDFAVEVEPTDRVLDRLDFIKRHLDGTLTMRSACAHGICGSDAMVINGRNRLACKFLVKDAVKESKTVTSADQHARFDFTTPCILCAACTTACPTF